MFKKSFKIFAAALLLALPSNAAGGDCSALAVTTTSGAETTNIAFDVTGSAASSLTVIVVGDTLGEFSATFGTATLTLGLEPPFFALPLGTTDLNGDLSTSFDIPAGAAAGDWNAQSVSVEFAPATGLGFCTSNVASFSL